MNKIPLCDKFTTTDYLSFSINNKFTTTDYVWFSINNKLSLYLNFRIPLCTIKNRKIIRHVCTGQRRFEKASWSEE